MAREILFLDINLGCGRKIADTGTVIRTQRVKRIFLERFNREKKYNELIGVIDTKDGMLIIKTVKGKRLG